MTSLTTDEKIGMSLDDLITKTKGPKAADVAGGQSKEGDKQKRLQFFKKTGGGVNAPSFPMGLGTQPTGIPTYLPNSGLGGRPLMKPPMGGLQGVPINPLLAQAVAAGSAYPSAPPLMFPPGMGGLPVTMPGGINLGIPSSAPSITLPGLGAIPIVNKPADTPAPAKPLLQPSLGTEVLASTLLQTANQVAATMSLLNKDDKEIRATLDTIMRNSASISDPSIAMLVSNVVSQLADKVLAKGPTSSSAPSAPSTSPIATAMATDDRGGETAKPTFVKVHGRDGPAVKKVTAGSDAGPLPLHLQLQRLQQMHTNPKSRGNPAEASLARRKQEASARLRETREQQMAAARGHDHKKVVRQSAVDRSVAAPTRPTGRTKLLLRERFERIATTGSASYP